MSEQFLTSECLRKYYSELTFLCPNVTRKSRRQRERIKKKLKTQLSGKIRVNLKKIQVNNEQINEKTCIKGSSAEKSVVKEDQQYDVSKEDAEESDIIDVGVEDSAHIIISHESLLQQQTTENRYELDLTASIDTQCTTVTTTRTNLNINLQQRKFELTPNNNNGLSVNVDIPTFDVEKLQNGDTVSESSVEPAKVPTKVFVFNVPRAFTSCCFENPISFDLCKPEDMVQIIAPQVRNLLHKCPDDETLQATKILEQINDEHGMLINEKPSTSKRGRKRSTTNNNISGQPSAIKKKRGRKPKNQVQQEGELRSLTEFYENAGWIFEDQVATPQRVTDENIGLDSTVVNNNYVYNNNELVEFPLNPNGYTSVETLENLLKNSEPDPNANQLLAHNNNANNVDLTLNQIYYSVPLNIMNEAIDLQNANNKAEELENQLNLTQVNQFGEPYVCPVDEAFQEGLSMPNIDEMSNLLQTNFDANEITNIAEVKENTIDCPNELEADKENSIANQNNVLDIDDVVGFKEDAEQLMNFNNKGNEADICKNIGNNEDSQANVIDKMEKEEVVECQEAKQELDRIDIVEKKETFEKQLENVSQVTEGSFRLLSPDIFDDCLNLENEAIHSEGHECSIMKAEMNKIEEVERKCESYSWATGSQSPDIFENNDCLLLETETDVLPFTEKEEKSNPNEQKPPIMYDNEGLRSNDESDNKKQEKVVENKSMLEEEMEIVNNEISLNNELDDDVLSLSASSLSDFETEEVNVKENMKMKIKVTSPTLQPTPTQTPLPPLPPPPPTPLPQKKKNVSRFSPLVTTSNYDNIMATSTSFKTLLNNNYKIPKLVNSQRTSTPILTPQQAQQPETPISTGDLFPIATSTPIPTPITTKTMTLVNQREIFTEATTTTTATIQNKEKTLPNIRIQIVNKNTKYEKYKIVQKQNVENQTTLEMATVADHLLTPPGDNYGKSNLDLARIFGIDCFAHAFNNEEIPHEMCEKSHNLMPQSDVISILSTLSKEDLLAAYRFVKNHRRLFKEYAVCFTSNMVSRRYVDVLLAMVHDCRLYADLADVTLTFLFIALRQCDMEPDIICKAFLKSVLDHADETYFPVLHSLLGLIMVSGHWTRFSTEINQISNLKNFCMDFNFVSHMIETCLSTQLDECHTTLTLQCLLNLNSEVSQALREEESVIRFLQLFQKAS